MTQAPAARYKVLGYVPLDDHGEAYRAQTSKYKRLEVLPPRIYQARETAERYSPCKQARKVLMVLE